MCVGWRRVGRRHPFDRPLGRVLQRIARKPVPDGGANVDLAVVSHLQKIEQHVGDLLADVLLRRRRQVGLARLLRRHPLEDFRQLGRLDHQRRRQVLRCVKGLPVAFRGEVAQRGLNVCEIHRAVSPWFFVIVVSCQPEAVRRRPHKLP